MFERHGTALSYVEFEDLCLHELPVALSKDQVRRPDPLPRRIPPLHQRCQQPNAATSSTQHSEQPSLGGGVATRSAWQPSSLGGGVATHSA